MAFLKKNWCLMIITTLLFLLVYTIYTSSIPLPDVVNHVDDHITVGFSQIETDNPWRTTQINSFREAFGPSNIEFIYHEPEEYTAKWQQEDITKLIREKVDYLVIVPADLDALVPALESAKEAGIPVMAHLGLTPQSVNAFGGNRVQGKTEAAAKKLIEDALAVQEAGAFAVVLECIPEKLAKIVTEKLDIPTIGIGAGAGCDGQILVYQDMLGMFSDYVPKFVKKFANVGDVMKQAFKDYISEVSAGTYPAQEHTFKIDEDVLEKLY